MVFLKKVYRYSKPLGIGMLFFVLVQLFCFYKGGMVFSPWYNYGMFSERIEMKPQYPVNRVDGLRGKDYTPQTWDKIHYTLQQIQDQGKNDSLYENEVKRIFSKMHLPVAKKNKFISLTADENAAPWYREYILSTLGIPDILWVATTIDYKWDGEKLVFLQNSDR
ncbi:MAG: hypothetical protein V4722_06070 [Bacteroidota bacterium]